MKQHDLITALRARGRSDALAQAAADEIERLRGLAAPAPTPAPTPDGFIITEKVKPPVKAAAKKAPAKKTAGKAKK